MSQAVGSSKKAPKERIIPIQLEGDDSKVILPTSSTPNVRTPSKKQGRQDKTTTKQPIEPETSIISDDSDSIDENNVYDGVKALSLGSEKKEKSAVNDNSLNDVVVIPQRSLPTYNVPEKIIIVLDRANDENCTNFEMTTGKQYSPLFMLQHALQLFLYNKSFIDTRHQFALMVLNENSATWVHDFTNAPQDIIASVRSMTEFPCDPEDIFDLNSVFDIINKKVEVNPTSKDLTIPPLEVVRTILLYGRSYSIPQLTRTQEIETLLSSPYFTVDVVMTHEPPDAANHCDRIFKALQEIDRKGFAYSFSVSRNASELHCAMAKVLSHPLQRPHQLHAKYDVASFK